MASPSRMVRGWPWDKDSKQPHLLISSLSVMFWSYLLLAFLILNSTSRSLKPGKHSLNWRSPRSNKTGRALKGFRLQSGSSCCHRNRTINKRAWTTDYVSRPLCNSLLVLSALFCPPLDFTVPREKQKPKWEMGCEQVRENKTSQVLSSTPVYLITGLQARTTWRTCNRLSNRDLV